MLTSLMNHFDFYSLDDTPGKFVSLNNSGIFRENFRELRELTEELEDIEEMEYIHVVEATGFFPVSKEGRGEVFKSGISYANFPFELFLYDDWTFRLNITSLRLDFKGVGPERQQKAIGLLNLKYLRILRLEEVVPSQALLDTIASHSKLEILEITYCQPPMRKFEIFPRIPSLKAVAVGLSEGRSCPIFHSVMIPGNKYLMNLQYLDLGQFSLSSAAKKTLSPRIKSLLA